VKPSVECSIEILGISDIYILEDIVYSEIRIFNHKGDVVKVYFCTHTEWAGVDFHAGGGRCYTTNCLNNISSNHRKHILRAKKNLSAFFKIIDHYTCDRCVHQNNHILKGECDEIFRVL